jgi:hypothetical protein
VKKLLFIPLDYQHKPYQEFYEAFCKRFVTYYYSDNVKYSDIDYIFARCGVLPVDKMIELKQKTGAFLMQWTGDAKDYILPEVVMYKDCADLTLLASGIGQKEMYETALGHPVRYFQHHVSDWQFLPVKNIKQGNNHFEGAVERNNLCELLTSKFTQFEVWGNGYNLPQYRNPSSMPFHEAHHMYNKAYISISANCFNDIEGYYSDRPLHIMAAGGCCLMRYTPNIERWFTDMEHCVFYHSNDEAVEKINMLIANPELRNKIALQGQEQVMKFHHNDFRVLELIEYLRELNK